MPLLEIAKQFSCSACNVETLGNGHINDTYLVTTAAKPFVLQKINRHVFTQPELIMANLAVLNQHVVQENLSHVALELPRMLLTESGDNHYVDVHGEFWRALTYIDNTESLETLVNVAQAVQVGAALGQFHRLTQGLDAAKLHDTLPGFHIAPSYWTHYQQALTRTSIKKETFCADFVERFQHIVYDLETAKDQGLLVVRAIHGDPKLNNFLFDKDSQEIVSLIDLDTVKPGLIHYDIGDCIRSCCHNLVTDMFDLECCQALLNGYFKAMADSLSADDYQLLYAAIRLIPFELGLRFYTDYLEGNRYFKVTTADENLHRAIKQFRLCGSILAQEADIKALIDRANAPLWGGLTLAVSR